MKCNAWQIGNSVARVPYRGNQRGARFCRIWQPLPTRYNRARRKFCLQTGVYKEMTTDTAGRKYLHEKQLKDGMQVETDDGFTCMIPGTRFVFQDNGSDFYLRCDEGKHYLSAQLDKKGFLIGIYPVQDIIDL